MKREEKKYKHPSFGMLNISRIHGKSGYLFGTEIQADNFIELTLSSATMKRDLTQDWFHEDDTLFRVKMSPNQFSELMTNLNTSPGVPVTIEEILRRKSGAMHRYGKQERLHSEDVPTKDGKLDC